MALLGQWTWIWRGSERLCLIDETGRLKSIRSHLFALDLCNHENSYLMNTNITPPQPNDSAKRAHPVLFFNIYCSLVKFKVTLVISVQKKYSGNNFSVLHKYKRENQWGLWGDNAWASAITCKSIILCSIFSAEKKICMLLVFFLLSC